MENHVDSHVNIESTSSGCGIAEPTNYSDYTEFMMQWQTAAKDKLSEFTEEELFEAFL